MRYLLQICGLVLGLSASAYADNVAALSPSNNSEIQGRFSTSSDMSNVNESVGMTARLPFKPGWYGHKRDVTYIRLIGVGAEDMGLSALFSTTGLQCPINEYLLFKKSAKTANTYNYTVGNGCIATITYDATHGEFTMTVNSRSKCFEEYTYQQFCNGDLDQENMNEPLSNYFIGDKFVYAKDQNDNDYDYNDD